MSQWSRLLEKAGGHTHLPVSRSASAALQLLGDNALLFERLNLCLEGVGQFNELRLPP